LADHVIMPLPNQPVTLNVEQIAALTRKLAALRHDVNNNLALVTAAVEIIRRKPESTERMLTGLAEKPRKIAESVAQFASELEAALGITRP
jgi:prophage DNA circulation protein